MPGIWLEVPHLKQRHPSDCMAACAAMVLDYLKRPIPYERLLGWLEIDPKIGAPAARIRRLAGLVGRVIYRSGTLKDITESLRLGLPPIAFVHTLQLGYWARNTRHAVVVIGIDEVGDKIRLNDPFFDNAPQAISLLEFQLAWDEMDNLYAVLIP
jgi:ABC-type bacteriocin/lantibiotic exporter with double-glycine peptidase domain